MCLYFNNTEYFVMSKVRTFVGYYKVSAAGIINVMARSAVTITATKVNKGTSTPLVAATLATALSGIVENNQLVPVTTINEDVAAGILGYFVTTEADATASGVTNSIKIGLMVADTGVNKGKGVVVLTIKNSSGKQVVELPIEAESGGT